MEPLIETLRHISLFSSADPQKLKKMLFREDCRIVTVVTGTSLSDSEKILGVMLSGTAMVLSNDKGRTVILRTLAAGDIFGAAALFCPEDLPLSRIEATTSCSILCLSEDAIRELVTSDTGVLNEYLTFLAGRVRFLNRKICCFTAGSAMRRLALWLAAEEHDIVTLPSSLSALSEMLDIGRASLYRAFDNLTAEHIIRKNGRIITILDRKRLIDNLK